MKAFKWKFIFLLLFFSSSTLFCQEGPLNETRIELSVLKKVNILRDSLNLPSLSLDNTLSEAAADHAFFMARTRKLTHYQNTFTKETQAERIIYYGGNRTYTGENVASTMILRDSLGLINYEGIADSLFMSWYNSKDHYKNMTHPDFTLMSLSYSVSQEKLIYAAQVFSSDEIQLPSDFRNENRAWGVRPSEITCKDDELRYETMFFANNVVVQGNDIYFSFHDINFFNGVFNSQNDGMAVDIILREQLPCDKENQFHISEIHDGEMQQPIYLMDMLRKDISGNKNKIFVKIGELPEYLEGKQWQPNIIVINDNKLCDYSYPVEVPSAIFPLLHLDPYFEEPDSTEILKEDYSFFMSDTLNAELWYGNREENYSNDVSGDMEVILELKSLIKDITVNSYTSVNGAEWYNQELLIKREENAREIMEALEFSDSQVKYQASENWEMMDSQIAEHGLAYLQNKTKPQIKSYLKKNKTTFLDSLLHEQRKTRITAVADTSVLVNSYSRYLLGRAYGLNIPLDSINWNEILKNTYILNEKEIAEDLIDSLRDNPFLRTNLFGAASIKGVNQRLDSVLVEEFIEECDVKNSRQSFNYAHFLTKYWFTKYAFDYRLETAARSITPEELRERLEEIDLEVIDSTDFIRLQVNTLLAGIHYYVAHNNWTYVDTYFNKISDLVKLEGFTPEEATELALFCNHFHKFKIAVDILRPFHDEVLLPEDGYFVLAKTASLIRHRLEDEEYWAFMNSAKRANEPRYCYWLDTSFQIQRDEFIKRDFCKTCK